MSFLEVPQQYSFLLPVPLKLFQNKIFKNFAMFRHYSSKLQVIRHRNQEPQIVGIGPTS